jgi:DNA-binding transcriptional ArsR family regulator
MAKLTPQAMDIVAERFRTLGEPMRLRILDGLRHGELSVGALVERTGGGQANVSKHLQILLGAGLVARRKAGTTVLYRLTDPTVFQLCDIVCGRVEDQLASRRKALGRR